MVGINAAVASEAYTFEHRIMGGCDGVTLLRGRVERGGRKTSNCIRKGNDLEVCMGQRQAGWGHWIQMRSRLKKMDSE